MASQNTGADGGRGGAGGGAGGAVPDLGAMLGVWTSWMEAVSGPAAQGWASAAKPWWEVAGGDDLLAGGAKQIGDTLAKDPFLRTVDSHVERQSRCARSCRWTGRGSPARSARCGCGPSAGPTPRWRPRWS
jgi:hypothetical protein